MVELINAKEIQKSFETEARLNTAAGEVIKTLKNDIQPVLNVNPQRNLNIIRRVIDAGTVYTTPTDKDFYLVGSQMTISNDTASQVSTGTLTVTPEGGESTVFQSLVLNTSLLIDSAQDNNTVTLPIPLKLKRGTNLTLAVSNTNAEVLVIYGYTVDS